MPARERMIRVYDRKMLGRNERGYWGDSGYLNFGYWSAGAKTQREASEALVDQLVARIAKKGGRILDVACGLGASTKRLIQTYASSDMITGINISEMQIAKARVRAAGCMFLVMDATKLGFPDDYFDAVICVESAYHFDTRDKFLTEAHRVLKRGGSLVMSDILFRNFLSGLLAFSPGANLVLNISGYRARLAAAGFNAIDVTDATDSCLREFRNNLGRWRREERRAGRMKFSRSLGEAVGLKMLSAYFGLISKTYVLVSAQKKGR